MTIIKTNQTPLKLGNESVQRVEVEESTRHKWVNFESFFRWCMFAGVRVGGGEEEGGISLLPGNILCQTTYGKYMYL